MAECDDIHFGATIGAPSQSCLGTANDDQRLGLYCDSGCFHRHGSLRPVDPWCIPVPIGESCSDARSKVLKERLKISQQLSFAISEEKRALTGKRSRVAVKAMGLAPPDFLWNLMGLPHLMRLCLRKGAHAALSSAAWQDIRFAPSFSAHVGLGEQGAPDRSVAYAGMFGERLR